MNLLKKPLLPTGLKQFHDWSNRIIIKADMEATAESQRYTLAHILTQLPAHVDAEYDHIFVSMLRKAAVNQVAIAYRDEVYKQKQNQAAATATSAADGKVLANTGVPSAKQ